MMVVLGNYVFILSLYFFRLTEVYADRSSRIVGGFDAPVESYPWFVKFSGCGGSLISPEFVLTAGESSKSTVYIDLKNLILNDALFHL